MDDNLDVDWDVEFFVFDENVDKVVVICEVLGIVL